MLPKRTEFFELLAAHSERVLAGANAMLRLINDLGVSTQEVAALVQEINMNEASADQIKADLLLMLHRSFVTPLNRDQVYALTLDIDRIMNAVQDVAQAVGMYNITESNSESRELASMAVEACSRLTQAIAALKERERSDKTMNLCVEIERIEEKSDLVMRRAIKALFEHEGDDLAALRALRLREFYALQEKVLRSCKAAAQMLEEILIQNV
jgi:predicted phosphate transport protein (TIGR00153 family)